MTFAQPLWFWAFALFPIILVLFFNNESRREKLIRKLVAARLYDRLAGSVSVAGRRWRMIVFLLGLACVIVSLAQPQWGYTWEQSQRKGRDVLIAIDCSRSMLATDLTPSRLGRAKLAAQDLINDLQGDRVGLIAFAGSAFLQAPLTVDYGAVLNSLSELDTNIIPRGGTDIAAAIKQAVEAFGKGEGDNRCLIILTDGEELDANAIAAAEEQKDKIKIFTVGLGSADGSLIPIPDAKGGTSFVKDENGQIVKSRLDEDRLRKIAEATGGFYVHLQSGPAEMQQIVRSGLGQMKEQDIDARMSRRPIERYQWPLAAGLTLLAFSSLISERKRGDRRAKLPPVTIAGLLLALSFWGNEVQAAAIKNPGVEAYQRGDQTAQRGAELAEQKDQTGAEQQLADAKKEFGGAYDAFAKQLKQQPGSAELNFNLGAAAYKLGKVDEALQAFSKATLTEKPALRVDAESNIASTLYRKGADRLAEGTAKQQDFKKDTLKDWKDGLRHFDEALKVQPDNRQVQGHREFLRRKIEELEKEPPKQEQQQQNKDDKNQDQKKDQDKKDDSKDQKNQQNQSKDQKKDDQKNQDQSQGQNKDQQQPDKGDGKPQEQPKDGKDQQNQQGKNDPSKQDQSGEGKDQKDSKNDPGKNDPSQKPQDGKGEPAQPAPDEGGKARDGQIGSQGNPQQAQQQPPADPQQEAAAEAQAAQEGRMTEAQAKSLLESLKNDDQRVQLLKPGERRSSGRPMRDW